MKKMSDPTFIKCMRYFLTTYLPIVRKRSDNTVNNYKDAIKLYIQWLKEEKKKPLESICANDFIQENVVSFLNWLKVNRKCCATTINQRLSHIKSFCRYLINTHPEYLPIVGEVLNIGDYVDERKENFVWLTIEQMNMLLNLPDRTKRTGLRDFFFLSLIYDSGCRESEILNLKVKDFVKEKDGCALLHIFGKGNKHRITPISKNVTGYFEEYCKVFHKEVAPDDYLFYTVHAGFRTKMSADNVRLLLLAYEKKAKEMDNGFPHLHSHIFRRTRAMLLYQGGMPLPLVAEWLGHSQIETTTIYAKATIEMKKAARDKVAKNQSSVFHNDEEFKYADDEDILKKLMGL